MAHATGFHGLVFTPLARALASSFHCWAYDARGHGDSGLPADGDFAWEGLGRDALAVIDGVGLTRPFGLGHSGGGAGLLIAEIERPGTFRAIYDFEPVVFPTDGIPAPRRNNVLAGSARRRREVFPTRSAAAANFMAKPPLSDFAPAALAAYVEHGFEDLPDGTVRLKCRGESEARVYEMAVEHRTYDQLAAIHCPVTLACGADTESLGEPVMRAIAARLASATVDVLPGLGHLGPMQDPDAVAASVRRAFGGE